VHAFQERLFDLLNVAYSSISVISWQTCWVLVLTRLQRRP
jgi:hypothetical protein